MSEPDSDATEEAAGALRRLLASVPPAPREPSPRARDLIYAYTGKQRALLIVGLAMLPLGLLLGVLFNWGLPSDLILAFRGEPATGQVVSAKLDRSTRINGVHPTDLRFSYRVEGVPYEAGSSTTDRDLARGLVEGASVPIEVARGAPSVARVRGTTVSTFGYGGAFTLALPFIGAFLLLAAVRSNRREIRAFTYGQPILARVVFAGPDTSIRVNGRNPFRVDWEFSVDGRVFTGSISSMRLLQLEDLMKAKELVVVYLPDDPRVNTVYLP